MCSCSSTFCSGSFPQHHSTFRLKPSALLQRSHFKATDLARVHPRLPFHPNTKHRKRKQSPSVAGMTSPSKAVCGRSLEGLQRLLEVPDPRFPLLLCVRVVAEGGKRCRRGENCRFGESLIFLVVSFRETRVGKTETRRRHTFRHNIFGVREQTPCLSLVNVLLVLFCIPGCRGTATCYKIRPPGTLRGGGAKSREVRAP